MSDRRPLMPKATAVWLVENTALSFDQIAEFCGLHPLEVKGIADGEVAQGIKGMDPVTNGQLTRDEIAKAEKDSSHKLQLAESKVQLPRLPQTRHDRPNAVLWLLRNHPELKDSQIMRLVGTTKPTIAQIRDRTHWNSAQLTPQDPVTLGLCSQIDLDAEVKKAAKRTERDRKDSGLDQEKAGTLLPASETTASSTTAQILAPKAAEEAPEETPEQEQARVFAKLKGMTSPKAEEETDEDDSKPEDSKEPDGE